MHLIIVEDLILVSIKNFRWRRVAESRDPYFVPNSQLPAPSHSYSFYTIPHPHSLVCFNSPPFFEFPSWGMILPDPLHLKIYIVQL